jgi:hypothetical protein
LFDPTNSLTELPAFTLEGDVEAISKTFSKDSVEEIKAELASLRYPWAKDALRRMEKMSPLSLATIHRLISDARNSNYYDFLPIEYRAAQNIRVSAILVFISVSNVSLFLGIDT